MPVDFSVVIPTLGRPTLERAMASVGAQSFLAREIIVVENGLERIGDRIGMVGHGGSGVCPVRVFSLPPFSGPSVCRNLGAWVAGGSFVAFLDDDDEFAPDYLEQISRVIERTSSNVLYGAKVWRDEDGRVQREKRLSTVPGPSWLDRLYCHENPGFGGQNLVAERAAFFQVGGFPVHLPSGEDRAFAMAALSAGCNIEYVDRAEVLCHDPVGWRANGRPDKWLTNLEIMHAYWGQVHWGTRFRSIWRWVRMAVANRGRHSTSVVESASLLGAKGQHSGISPNVPTTRG